MSPTERPAGPRTLLRDSQEAPPRLCTIGVMVHDEAQNIGQCLRSLLAQEGSSIAVERIVVVSSGSTDGTDEIVAALAERHPEITLIREPQRRGKIVALNRLLATCSKGELIALIGGDLVAEPEWLENLLAPFDDPRVGMTGGRPVPIDEERGLCGTLTHVLWRVHHRVALERPKLGEAVAFRHTGDAIPEDVIVDEAFLEHRMLESGWRLEYAPDAIVHNKGPETASDFVRQYRRNVAGHLVLQHQFGYRVATLSLARTWRALWPELGWSPKRWLLIGMIGALSLYARALGHWDYRHRPERHRVWEIAKTTKRRIALEPASGERR
ncbi:MAG: glycosyltransferase [Planctomycetota bacterium]